jgi:alkylhydroperoxidase family enzyme
VDYQHSKISIADKALLNYCAKLNSNGKKITASDVEKLRTFGFSDQQIMEAAVVVGFAQFANTVSFGLGTVPDFRNSAVEAALGYTEQPTSGSDATVVADSRE